jgi:hypothetical protein
MSSHSQLGQDAWAMQHAEAALAKGFEKFYVEIGSANAVDLSNTLLLEQEGWAGVSVDPFPTGDWGARKNPVVATVLWPEETTVDFRSAGELGGVDSCIDTHRAAVESFPVVKLQTTSIRDFVARTPIPAKFAYMSLDTEGSEHLLLEAWPFAERRPFAVSVEHNFEQAKRQLIRDILEANGYAHAGALRWDDLYLFAG